MSWQIIIILQVVAGTAITLLSRRFALKSEKSFFSIGLFSYFAIAISGMLVSLIANQGLPPLPSSAAWWFIVAEGVFIPMGWLVQLYLIKSIGASNAVLVGMFNSLVIATLSIVLYHDAISPMFLLGAAFLVTSSVIALRIKPDETHSSHDAFSRKVGLVLFGAVTAAIGAICEKQAIDMTGVWNYAVFGWAMQAVGTGIIFAFFGRKELPHLTKHVVRRGLALGFLTSLSGGLYIYAISIGTLSHTILAATSRAGLIMLLSAIFFRERNALRKRVLAFLLAIAGIWCVVG